MLIYIKISPLVNLFLNMFIALLSLMIGMAIGGYCNKSILRSNDKFYTIISTLFIFFMGLSLGLSRSFFYDAGTMLINAIALSLLLPVGSIFFTKIFINLNN